MKRDYSYLRGNKFAMGHKPNKTSFKPGMIPWNKGLKGIHLSPESEFKKGHRLTERKPLFYVTIRIDKNSTYRWWIKIEQPNKWIEYAKWLWVSSHGPVPDGYVVHHIDKDSLNDSLDNLESLTRKEHINKHRTELTQRRLEE